MIAERDFHGRGIGEGEARRSHVEDLWTRVIAEGLAPEEEAELVAALAADPALCEELLAHQWMEGALLALGRGARDGEAFTRRFAERVALASADAR
jgi:hypothetical protein